MKTIGAFEAKNKFSELLDIAESGEEIVITRNGKPVARLRPYTVKPGSPEAIAASERIEELRKRINARMTQEEIVALVKEARKR
ncbi:MAG TPA: type II toxin-antitoxin system prevent-host-death family antitoxin [Alphaproteobacteria bacterium]